MQRNHEAVTGKAASTTAAYSSDHPFHERALVCDVPLLDPLLQVTTKGLYAYLCCISDSQKMFNLTTQFEQILQDLGIGKKGFDKYFDQLLDHGYVELYDPQKSVDQYKITDPPKPPQLFKHKKYTQTKAIPNSHDLPHSQEGMGLVSKKIMKDPSIPLQIKGVIGHHSIYAFSSDNRLPVVSDILYYLNVTLKTYGRYMKYVLQHDLDTFRIVEETGENPLLKVDI